MLVSMPPSMALHPQSFFGLDNPVPVTPLSSSPPPPSTLISGPSCVEKQLGRGRWWPSDSLYFMTLTKPSFPRCNQRKDKERTTRDTWLRFGKMGKDSWVHERESPPTGISRNKVQRKKEQRVDRHRKKKKARPLSETEAKWGRRWEDLSSWRQDGSKHFSQGGEYYDCNVVNTVCVAVLLNWLSLTSVLAFCHPACIKKMI